MFLESGGVEGDGSRAVGVPQGRIVKAVRCSLHSVEDITPPGRISGVGHSVSVICGHHYQRVVF